MTLLDTPHFVFDDPYTGSVLDFVGAAPLEPPAAWFSQDAADEAPEKIMVFPGGRVAGVVAPAGRCLLNGSSTECWTPPRPRDAEAEYAMANAGFTPTQEGHMVRTGVLGGGKGHADPFASAPVAQKFYAETSTQLMRGTYRWSDKAGGVVFVGALWPEITPRQIAEINASPASIDYRWIQDEQDHRLVGCTLVNIGGLPTRWRATRTAAAIIMEPEREDACDDCGRGIHASLVVDHCEVCENAIMAAEETARERWARWDAEHPREQKVNRYGDAKENDQLVMKLTGDDLGALADAVRDLADSDTLTDSREAGRLERKLSEASRKVESFGRVDAQLRFTKDEVGWMHDAMADVVDQPSLAGRGSKALYQRISEGSRMMEAELTPEEREAYDKILFPKRSAMASCEVCGTVIASCEVCHAPITASEESARERWARWDEEHPREKKEREKGRGKSEKIGEHIYQEDPDSDGNTVEIMKPAGRTPRGDQTLDVVGRMDLFSNTLHVEGRPSRSMPKFKTREEGLAWAEKQLKLFPPRKK